MVELILAVLILVAAIYVIYRLATDPASDLDLESDLPSSSAQIGPDVEPVATEIGTGARQDGSLESVAVFPPD